MSVLVGCAVLPSCKPKTQHFSTNVEVIQVRSFGKTTRLTDLELKFSDCPGTVRKIVRAGQDFAACADKLKVGDKLKADVEYLYVEDRDQFRDDIVHLGDCDVKSDAKDEANYETVENCSEVKVTGAVVGVHCDITRSKELVAACPWLGRK